MKDNERYISPIGESWWQEDLGIAAGDFPCPACRSLLNIKRIGDFTVDTETDAVYCAYCSEFLGYIWDFQPLE